MTANYIPHGGSIGGRALAHLQALPPGTELASGPLAEALGVNSSMINVCLDTAAKHHVLARDKREGRIFWSLGPRAPAPDTHPAEVDDKADVPDLAVKQVRVDASTAAPPIEGLAQQSWCPVAQESGAESSLDEPPAPTPPSPAPPPTGPNWPFPRSTVFPADAPEPGPAAVLAVTPENDPDFQEVRRAPATPEPDTPPEGSRSGSSSRAPVWKRRRHAERRRRLAAEARRVPLRALVLGRASHRAVPRQFHAADEGRDAPTGRLPRSHGGGS